MPVANMLAVQVQITIPLPTLISENQQQEIIFIKSQTMTKDTTMELLLAMKIQEMFP